MYFVTALSNEGMSDPNIIKILAEISGSIKTKKANKLLSRNSWFVPTEC